MTNRRARCARALCLFLSEEVDRVRMCSWAFFLMGGLGFRGHRVVGATAAAQGRQQQRRFPRHAPGLHSEYPPPP